MGSWSGLRRSAQSQIDDTEGRWFCGIPPAVGTICPILAVSWESLVKVLALLSPGRWSWSSRSRPEAPTGFVSWIARSSPSGKTSSPEKRRGIEAISPDDFCTLCRRVEIIVVLIGAVLWSSGCPGSRKSIAVLDRRVRDLREYVNSGASLGGRPAGKGTIRSRKSERARRLKAGSRPGVPPPRLSPRHEAERPGPGLRQDSSA